MFLDVQSVQEIAYLMCAFLTFEVYQAYERYFQKDLKHGNE